MRSWQSEFFGAVQLRTSDKFSQGKAMNNQELNLTYIYNYTYIYIIIYIFTIYICLYNVLIIYTHSPTIQSLPYENCPGLAVDGAMSLLVSLCRVAGSAENLADRPGTLVQASKKASKCCADINIHCRVRISGARFTMICTHVSIYSYIYIS